MSDRVVDLAAGGEPDAVLLGRFAARRDEAAFAELVRRHGPVVWGVCRRRLARREDAEDAFQATFLILAVKAGSIRRPAALAGWLHRTASRAAARVASVAPGEANVEAEAGGLDAFAELARREATAAVDEELVRLPGRYRDPIVLFHLEGLDRRQVADRLGVSEPTVKA
ncbi:MAG TPA: sigma-70 family RNA polymerase sigma factor, partial [Planctomycetaceae bacterium]